MATYSGSDKRLQYLFNASGNLAEDYDSTSTYAVDDYAMYQGTLYKCTMAVSTAEDFDSTKWTAVLITDEMGSGGGGSNVWTGTQAQYTAQASSIQDGTLVTITDDEFEIIYAESEDF